MRKDGALDARTVKLLSRMNVSLADWAASAMKNITRTIEVNKGSLIEHRVACLIAVRFAATELVGWSTLVTRFANVEGTFGVTHAAPRPVERPLNGYTEPQPPVEADETTTRIYQTMRQLTRQLDRIDAAFAASNIDVQRLNNALMKLTARQAAQNCLNRTGDFVILLNKNRTQKFWSVLGDIPSLYSVIADLGEILDGKLPDLMDTLDALGAVRKGYDGVRNHFMTGARDAQPGDKGTEADIEAVTQELLRHAILARAQCFVLASLAELKTDKEPVVYFRTSAELVSLAAHSLFSDYHASLGDFLDQCRVQ